MAKKELKRKEYIFTFKGGGWNTVWAKTLRGAKAAAKKEYAHMKDVEIIESSFRLTDRKTVNTLWALSR